MSTIIGGCILVYLVISACLSAFVSFHNEELRQRYNAQYNRQLRKNDLWFALMVMGLLWPVVLVVVLRYIWNNNH